jgi:hypothetical protein
MHADDRADDIKCIADIRDPIPDGLACGILQSPTTRGHLSDLRPQESHALNIWRLALHVLFSHIHDARDTCQCTHGGGSDAVLSRSGLGDHPFLTHPLSE